MLRSGSCSCLDGQVKVGVDAFLAFRAQMPIYKFLGYLVSPRDLSFGNLGLQPRSRTALVL